MSRTSTDSCLDDSIPVQERADYTQATSSGDGSSTHREIAADVISAVSADHVTVESSNSERISTGTYFAGVIL